MHAALKSLRIDTILLMGMPLGLLAGAWGIGQVTIDHLLRHDAIMTGQGWATYLADNVKDLDRIVAGDKPSGDSQRLFDRAQKVGQVFRYVIYDRAGRARLASNDLDDDDDDTKDAEARNPSAIQALSTGSPVVHAEESDAQERKIRPPFFAETYLPVLVGGQKIGVVETYVDQTEKRDSYRRTMLLTSTALVALITLSFGIPALAWRRRSREKRVADDRIRFLARHDALTGLINRDELLAIASRLMEDRAGRPDIAALHFIDIDHFKDINDTLGHQAGDTLIQAVADRLSSLVGAENLVARVGGDEFVVVQTEWACMAGASAFADGLVREMARPFDIAGHMVAVTASVGVALAPSHGENVARLMKSADLALYRAKANGRNGMAVFSPDMDHELSERLRLERAVRYAVETDGFVLHYQPVIEMPSQRLVGFEALIRMQDDAGASVSPALFIPVAEKMGLIDEIGTWVLRAACETAMTWPAGLKLAVNLSPVQLATGRLVESVRTILQETGLAPHRLELEITEGMLLENSAAVMSDLRKLKALQVGIVMDDFGTGYSSLSYLWKFPFDKIKIDRAFMLALGESSEEASTIVKTIIDLGRSLDVTVTVEGVENEDQLQFVSAANCDQIQGFYFGRPLPAEEVATRIIAEVQRQISGGDVAPKRNAA